MAERHRRKDHREDLGRSRRRRSEREDRYRRRKDSEQSVRGVWRRAPHLCESTGDVQQFLAQLQGRVGSLMLCRSKIDDGERWLRMVDAELEKLRKGMWVVDEVPAQAAGTLSGHTSLTVSYTRKVMKLDDRALCSFIHLMDSRLRFMATFSQLSWVWEIGMLRLCNLIVKARPLWVRSPQVLVDAFDCTMRVLQGAVISDHNPAQTQRRQGAPYPTPLTTESAGRIKEIAVLFPCLLVRLLEAGCDSTPTTVSWRGAQYVLPQDELKLLVDVTLDNSSTMPPAEAIQISSPAVLVSLDVLPRVHSKLSAGTLAPSAAAAILSQLPLFAGSRHPAIVSSLRSIARELPPDTPSKVHLIVANAIFLSETDDEEDDVPPQILLYRTLISHPSPWRRSALVSLPAIIAALPVLPLELLSNLFDVPDFATHLLDPSFRSFLSGLTEPPEDPPSDAPVPSNRHLASITHLHHPLLHAIALSLYKLVSEKGPFDPDTVAFVGGFLPLVCEQREDTIRNEVGHTNALCSCECPLWFPCLITGVCERGVDQQMARAVQHYLLIAASSTVQATRELGRATMQLARCVVGCESLLDTLRAVVTSHCWNTADTELRLEVMDGLVDIAHPSFPTTILGSALVSGIDTDAAMKYILRKSEALQGDDARLAVLAPLALGSGDCRGSGVTPILTAACRTFASKGVELLWSLLGVLAEATIDKENVLVLLNPWGEPLCEALQRDRNAAYYIASHGLGSISVDPATSPLMVAVMRRPLLTVSGAAEVLDAIVGTLFMQSMCDNQSLTGMVEWIIDMAEWIDDDAILRHIENGNLFLGYLLMLARARSDGPSALPFLCSAAQHLTYHQPVLGILAWRIFFSFAADHGVEDIKGSVENPEQCERVWMSVHIDEDGDVEEVLGEGMMLFSSPTATSSVFPESSRSFVSLDAIYFSFTTWTAATIKEAFTPVVPSLIAALLRRQYLSRLSNEPLCSLPTSVPAPDPASACTLSAVHELFAVYPLSLSPTDLMECHLFCDCPQALPPAPLGAYLQKHKELEAACVNTSEYLRTFSENSNDGATPAALLSVRSSPPDYLNIARELEVSLLAVVDEARETRKAGITLAKLLRGAFTEVEVAATVRVPHPVTGEEEEVQYTSVQSLYSRPSLTEEVARATMTATSRRLMWLQEELARILYVVERTHSPLLMETLVHILSRAEVLEGVRHVFLAWVESSSIVLAVTKVLASPERPIIPALDVLRANLRIISSFSDRSPSPGLLHEFLSQGGHGMAHDPPPLALHPPDTQCPVEVAVLVGVQATLDDSEAPGASTSSSSSPTLPNLFHSAVSAPYGRNGSRLVPPLIEITTLPGAYGLRYGPNNPLVCLVDLLRICCEDLPGDERLSLLNLLLEEPSVPESLVYAVVGGQLLEKVDTAQLVPVLPVVVARYPRLGSTLLVSMREAGQSATAFRGCLRLWRHSSTDIDWVQLLALESPDPTEVPALLADVRDAIREAGGEFESLHDLGSSVPLANFQRALRPVATLIPSWLASCGALKPEAMSVYVDLARVLSLAGARGRAGDLFLDISEAVVMLACDAEPEVVNRVWEFAAHLPAELQESFMGSIPWCMATFHRAPGRLEAMGDKHATLRCLQLLDWTAIDPTVGCELLLLLPPLALQDPQGVRKLVASLPPVPPQAAIPHVVERGRPLFHNMWTYLPAPRLGEVLRRSPLSQLVRSGRGGENMVQGLMALIGVITTLLLTRPDPDTTATFLAEMRLLLFVVVQSTNTAWVLPFDDHLFVIRDCMVPLVEHGAVKASQHFVATMLSCLSTTTPEDLVNSRLDTSHSLPFGFPHSELRAKCSTGFASLRTHVEDIITACCAKGTYDFCLNTLSSAPMLLAPDEPTPLLSRVLNAAVMGALRQPHSNPSALRDATSYLDISYEAMQSLVQLSAAHRQYHLLLLLLYKQLTGSTGKKQRVDEPIPVLKAVMGCLLSLKHEGRLDSAEGPLLSLYLLGCYLLSLPDWPLTRHTWDASYRFFKLLDGQGTTKTSGVKLLKKLLDDKEVDPIPPRFSLACTAAAVYCHRCLSAKMSGLPPDMQVAVKDLGTTKDFATRALRNQAKAKDAKQGIATQTADLAALAAPNSTIHTLASSLQKLHPEHPELKCLAF